MKMPFGKYRGELLEDLPFTYLDWLLTLELREPLRSAIKTEFERRTFSQGNRLVINVTLCDELISAGLRSLARRYHPDSEKGDHEKMVAVNQAADWLRSQVRVLA